MFRHRLNKQLGSTIADGSADGIDPDTTLLPLLIPHLLGMLRAGGSETEIAMMYLEILIDKKLLTSRKLPAYIASLGCNSSGSDFVDSLRAILKAFLTDIQFRHLWRRVEQILQCLAV
ncbi:hypothetical protein XU18_2853 [Perkinsela sp. CCAP 1560/4]|nr:hypothetical protein XU18_2853 [Perkinsela sp. CCAP 1560/4]|eukprot:KNH06348.1 hypothetical protein XU18_2853 [Perkinsela sp. CCAP 1560/4]